MMTDRIILSIDPATGLGGYGDPHASRKCSSTIYHSWQDLISIAHRSPGPTLVVEIGLETTATSEPAAVSLEILTKDTRLGTGLSATTALPSETGLREVNQAVAGAIGSEFRQLCRKMCSVERAKRFSDDLNDLSARQRDVLALIIQGQSCKEIAARLDVGLATAAKHRARIFKKLCVRNLVELVQLLNATFGWSPAQTSG